MELPASFEWKKDELRYGVVRYRCFYLGLRVGKIIGAEGELNLTGESFVAGSPTIVGPSLDAIKKQIENYFIEWFKRTIFKEAAYHAENHPDLFPGQTGSGAEIRGPEEPCPYDDKV